MGLVVGEVDGLVASCDVEGCESARDCARYILRPKRDSGNHRDRRHGQQDVQHSHCSFGRHACCARVSGSAREQATNELEKSPKT